MAFNLPWQSHVTFANFLANYARIYPFLLPPNSENHWNLGGRYRIVTGTLSSLPNINVIKYRVYKRAIVTLNLATHWWSARCYLRFMDPPRLAHFADSTLISKHNIRRKKSLIALAVTYPVCNGSGAQSTHFVKLSTFMIIYLFPFSVWGNVPWKSRTFSIGLHAWKLFKAERLANGPLLLIQQISHMRT